jgi:myo-inositol catabolism protein IolC
MPSQQQQFLILPFDHRSSFSRDLLGYEGHLNAKQKKKVKELKEIVFAGFEQVVLKDKHRGDFGVLIDEEYGAALLRRAKKMGVRTCVTVEKSGQTEFQFEYGASFGKHLNAFTPQYAKALVRYNPANVAENKRQLIRLATLSKFCHANGYGLLFELLVPPTKKDLERMKTQATYDKKLRPKLTAQAIREIQKRVDVDLWKLEGFTTPQWRLMLKTIKEPAKAIVLGRGADRKQVETWLRDAAKFDRIIGFAVGRTVFEQPLKQFIAKRISKTKTADNIARNFASFVKLWRSKK